jgi:hypothetical protein
LTKGRPRPMLSEAGTEGERKSLSRKKARKSERQRKKERETHIQR